LLIKALICNLYAFCGCNTLESSTTFNQYLNIAAGYSYRSDQSQKKIIAFVM